MIYDNQKGQLCQLIDILNQATQYCYDDYGRLRQAQMGQNYGITVTYYPPTQAAQGALQSGKVHTITLSNGLKNTYEYYPNGCLQKLSVMDTHSRGLDNVLLAIEYKYDPTTLNLIYANYSSTASPQDPNVNCSLEYEF